jgi:hypothetical protein
MPRERAGIWVGPEPAIAEFFYARGEGREGRDVDGNVTAGEKFLGDCEDYVGLPEFAVGEEEDFRGWSCHFLLGYNTDKRMYVQEVRLVESLQFFQRNKNLS